MSKQNAPHAAAEAAREFRVPLELLKQFKADLRIHPPVPPSAGWIMFDKEMLLSVLRSDKADVRAEFVKSLERYYEAGGQLVMVGHAAVE